MKAKEKMIERIFKLEGLDKYGYDDVLYSVKNYPRSRGEQIKVLRSRKTPPRVIEISIRSNLVFMVLIDITSEAGDYEQYEKVDEIWRKSVEEEEN